MHLVYYLWRSENWLILKKKFYCTGNAFFFKFGKIFKEKIKIYTNPSFFLNEEAVYTKSLFIICRTNDFLADHERDLSADADWPGCCQCRDCDRNQSQAQAA